MQPFSSHFLRNSLSLSLSLRPPSVRHCEGRRAAACGGLRRGRGRRAAGAAGRRIGTEARQGGRMDEYTQARECMHVGCSERGGGMVAGADERKRKMGRRVVSFGYERWMSKSQQTADEGNREAEPSSSGDRFDRLVEKTNQTRHKGMELRGGGR